MGAVHQKDRIAELEHEVSDLKARVDALEVFVQAMRGAAGTITGDE